VIRHAVTDVVARQRRARIDVVSDGEMSKINYATDIKYRRPDLTATVLAIRRPISKIIRKSLAKLAKSGGTPDRPSPTLRR
jgi:5-methyltetrahydropteroyltriglutamate--homocysteine methyltransferase